MSRRGRASRLNERAADASVPVGENPPAVGWDDLDPAAQAALMRLNRGHADGIDPPAGERLKALGLAVARATGLGITRAGRELAVAALLRPRGDVEHH